MKLIPALLAVLSTSLALGADEPPARFVPARKGDAATMAVEKDRLIVQFTSKTGIGGGTLTPAAKKWPATVVFKFYLNGLEQLSVGAGKNTWRLSVSSANPQELLVSLQDEARQERTVRKGEAMYPQVRVLNDKGEPVNRREGKGGCFEIVMPAALLEGAPDGLTLSWIDYFR